MKHYLWDAGKVHHQAANCSKHIVPGNYYPGTILMGLISTMQDFLSKKLEIKFINIPL